MCQASRTVRRRLAFHVPEEQYLPMKEKKKSFGRDNDISEYMKTNSIQVEIEGEEMTVCGAVGIHSSGWND